MKVDTSTELEPSEMRRQVALARDRQLADRGALGALVYPLVYGMIAFQTGFISRQPIIGKAFFVAFIVFAALRLALCLGFERFHPKKPVVWRIGFRSTLCGLGLLWGLIAAYTVLLEPWTPTSLFFLFSGSGLAGGMIATTAIDRLSYQLYLLGILVPPATAAILSEQQFGGVLCGFHVLYFGFLWLQGIRLSASFEESATNTITMVQQRDQLAEAKLVAEQASLAKSRLLANVSHELRTPMNAIIGVTEWAIEQNPTEKEAWSEVHNAGLQLLTVINQVLDFAKIDSGHFSEAKLEPFHLRETVNQVFLLFKRRAEEQKLDLVLDLKTDPDLVLRGDGGRYRQILCNLVGNAIKFTLRGTVRLVVEWKDETLITRVSDTGTGIKENYISSLFEPFSQADTSPTRRYGGTGLGLAISRDLANSMGGILSLEKNSSEGCVFCLTVPAEKATQSQRASAPSESPLRKRYRVLVVDDDPTNRKVADRQLRLLGLQPELAESGGRALELCDAEAFDFILMDLQMPELDGFETTAQLRASKTTKNSDTPVLAFTAHTGNVERSKCVKAGMVAFLNKPLQRKVLLEALTNLENQGLLAAAPAENDDSGPSLEDASSTETKSVRRHG